MSDKFTDHQVSDLTAKLVYSYTPEQLARMVLTLIEHKCELLDNGCGNNIGPVHNLQRIAWEI